jgi:uncharacterized protein involved in exopolysaccharide biosynthesis
MNRTQPSFRLSDVFAVLWAYPRRWLVPAVGVAVFALVFAMVKPRIWEASQALLVRNEAASAETAPGRFRDIDEMKVTQETILELVKGHRVLGDALLEVGPAGASWDKAPSADAIEDLRDAVSLTAPAGIEFGKTEISYLTVRDRDRQRAVALAAAVAKHLEQAIRRLRDAKAQSMVNELTKTVSVAEGDLVEATGRLATIERQLGADLSDLRNMELSATGDSDLRRRLNSIEDELRLVAADRQAAEVLHGLLTAAEKDPTRLVATPNRLMVSQPALLKLKEGLVTAQLKVSMLLGQMTEEHPQVLAAREEENEIARRMHEEVSVALRGIQADLRLATERNNWLEGQRRALQGRLERLAGVRPQYSTLLHEVSQRNEAVANARRKLAAAQAAHAGAQSAGLITFVDSPIAGKDPIGPGRTSIVLIGILGGLAAGGAVLFLTVPSLRSPAAEAEGQFTASQRGWGLNVPVAKAPTGTILGA